VIVAALLCPRAAVAHPVPFSYLDLRLQTDAIDGTLVAHIFDVGHDLNIEPAERLLDSAVVSQRAAEIMRLLSGRLTLTADGRTLVPHWSSVSALPDRQSLKVSVRFALAGRPGRVTVAAAFFPYDPNHQTFLNIYEGDALTQAILDRGRTEFEYFAGTRQGAFAVVRKFLPAGIHHILIGPDHLLFLVGLLLLGGSVRRLATIVTAFTVAHSITLSLAALNLVTPPPTIIEPAIALSIVFVGADNLMRGGGRDVRALIALTFGLVHGFGFANVLREFGLPREALGWSLFSFNVGVEIGQLFIVLLVATALAIVRRRNETIGTRVAFAGSLIVVAAGTYWFVQRVFFPTGI
jgi:hydrogenase/urease accessory protein HupE